MPHVATSRADDLELVDDDGGKINFESVGHGGLEDHRSARTHQLQRGFESLHASCRLHHGAHAAPRFEPSVARVHDFSANATSDLQIFVMVADQRHWAARRSQAHDGQQSQLPVAQHDDTVIITKVIEAVCGGGEWFREHRCIVRYVIRYSHEVPFGKRESFGQRAVPCSDPEHGPPGAVVSVPGQAIVAGSTPRVDVANNPFPEPRRVARFEHIRHELVSQDSTVRHVSARDLDVRIADAGNAHAKQRFSGLRHGCRVVVGQPWGGVGE